MQNRLAGLVEKRDSPRVARGDSTPIQLVTVPSKELTRLDAHFIGQCFECKSGYPSSWSLLLLYWLINGSHHGNNGLILLM